MNDIQTPEWIKESIIKGLNRKKPTPHRSIIDKWFDGFVVWAWKHLHNGGRR